MSQNVKKWYKKCWYTDHITSAILVQKGHARQKINEITSHFDPPPKKKNNNNTDLPCIKRQ